MKTEKMSLLDDAGVWLAAGGVLLAIILPIHGPTHADLTVQMQHIADGHGQWAAVHWVAALALVLLSGAGFMFFAEALTGRRSAASPGAWLLFGLGSLLTVGTAVAEATAVSGAADGGDFEAFVVWWRFSSGLGNGFLIVALAAACIAWRAAGADRPQMPQWLCRAGAVLALVSAVGWSLGQHFALGIGGPIWFVGTLLMSLWLAWFGVRSRRGAAG